MADEEEMLTEPISVVESTATDEERARLSLIPGETVYRADGIRRRGEQLLIESRCLPAALFPGLTTPIPRISGLADIYGLQLGMASEKVCAVAASADIAEALDVANGTLVLVLDRVVYLRDGRPAEWRVTHHVDRGTLTRLLARL
jgi:GntR family transcriptional regulator